MHQLPINMPNLPPHRERVDRAVSAENLRAAASAAKEPMVLLGFSFLARSGDPVRKELAEMAVRAKSEYTAIVAVLSVMLDRIDAESVGDLVQRDPDNALGHYLHGTLLHVSNRASEALDAFRKAAACAELRFYDSTTGEALFQALDALGLQGADRLCALSWTTSRWADFSSVGIQPVYGALSEMANTADAATRAELADTLLTLAGHLFGANFINRFFAQRAVERAFTIRAELAADQDPAKRNGYAAAVYGLVSPLYSSRGLKEWWNRSPLELAQALPGLIHAAFAAAEAPSRNPYAGGETKLTVPESERAAFEAATETAARAGKKLIEAALTDPDGIFGAYLKGLRRAERRPGVSPVFEWTPVEGLLQKYPALFQAAAANQEAAAALWRAGENAPSRRNVGRMLEIAWALLSYAQKHELAYPDNLAVLFEGGYLKPPLETKSVRTGRPYVYVAAGEKSPSKANDRAQFVLFYDDEPVAEGWYECAFASCLCNGVREADLKQQLKRRGK